MLTRFPTESFTQIETPFYYYDTDLLKETLESLKKAINPYKNFYVHYALKANSNSRLLQIISQYGIGADCVSGGEILKAINAGFKSTDIVYAGVGKTDKEIISGLFYEIFCFNVESLQEIEVINSLAKRENKTANICIRINPNVNAHTHAKITTGLSENKFGIPPENITYIIDFIKTLRNIKLIGLHFHIGSQITHFNDFKNLCFKINRVQEEFQKERNIIFEHINVGGGLGIDYESPDSNRIPSFSKYFNIFQKYLLIKPKQKIHFELGRSIVAQCGSLISKVLYVKEGITKKFAIIDAGMNDLLRPALYQAQHKIENLSSKRPLQKYDVVGPICESSDVFGADIMLNSCRRGDLIAIRSAGAYGEAMASTYNCRKLPYTYLKEDLKNEY